MISSTSLLKINNAVMPDLKNVFWIASSVDDAAAVNPNGAKTLLANSVSKSFINDKATGLNGLRKLRNSSSWLVVFLVASFNKITPFS